MGLHSEQPAVAAILQDIAVLESREGNKGTTQKG
jgi:hypothetical protein